MTKVLSPVERYLIQCPFVRGSFKRGSTVVESLMQVQIQWKHYQEVLEAGISEEFSFRVDTGGAGHGRG